MDKIERAQPPGASRAGHPCLRPKQIGIPDRLANVQQGGLMAETKTLAQYLAEKPKCDGFKAKLHYFHDGDYVTYFFQNDMAREERIDQLLTVYTSIETGRMVGCKIKGVVRILEELGNFAVTIDDGNVALGMLFIGAALVNPEERFTP